MDASRESNTTQGGLSSVYEGLGRKMCMKVCSELVGPNGFSSCPSGYDLVAGLHACVCVDCI